MSYDKKLLESWCEIEDYGDYLDRRGGLTKYTSQEGYDFLEREYYTELRRRINYCKKLLEEHGDPFIFYILARLYDRENLDESVEFLYKRPVRYYCIKAIRKDRKLAEVWALLAHAYSWVAFLGGESDTAPAMEVSFRKNVVISLSQENFLANTVNNEGAMRFIEKAITCASRAVEIDPLNKNYKKMLKEYYSQR